MAGHSKFKNIMHRKGAQDKKRSAATTRLVKEIAVAARLGGIDVEANPRLRLAISQAKGNNVGKEVIERAIARGGGSGGEQAPEEIRYEGYGPKGVAVVIEVATDNRNRSAAAMRAILSKHGGGLAEAGSVTHSFARKGLIKYPEAAADEERMLATAVELAAEDVVSADGEHSVITSIRDFHKIGIGLEKKFGSPRVAAMVWLPLVKLGLEDGGALESLDAMLAALEENEDVQAVFTNCEQRC